MAIPTVKKKTTFILAALTFVLLAVMVFVLNRKIYRRPPQPATYEQEMQVIETQSPSDDMESIENDVQNTNINVDDELNSMEKEINQTY